LITRVEMTPPKKYMYANPIGTATSGITRLRVALKANVRGTNCVLLGSRTLFDEARIRSTVEDPARNRMKVANRHMTRFRLLQGLVASVDNLVQSKAGEHDDI